MFHTYIRYCNTFQYKCASAIGFKRYFFTLYHIISLPIYVLSRLYFISWSTPPPLLFNWPRTQLCLKFPNHIYVLMWNIIHCVNLPNFFFHELKAFPNFSIFCFHRKITWNLGKVNRKVKRLSNWTDAQLTSFNVPLAYSLKRPINYCCRICTILCIIFKTRLFIEALCRPWFIKYAHCKPLFPFQNNA